MFVKIGSTTGPILSSWTPKRCCRPFALREYDLKHLNSNVSISDRFLTSSQGMAQFRQKKVKGRV